MMRAVALVIVSLAVYVHGQSPAPTMDSLSSSESSTLAASDEAAYSTTEKSSMLASISSGPLAVSNIITSTTAKSTTAEILSSMTLSDAQSLSKVTSTRGATEGDGSSTMAESLNSAVMPAQPTTLLDFMSAHVSVTTDGHPLPSAPSVNFTLATIPTPIGTPTPTHSTLSPIVFQLAIALPATVFGYTCLLILLVLVSLLC